MDVKILIAIFGAIGGCYMFVFKHIWERKKHPCSDDIVFKDVCTSERKRFDDSIKGASERMEQRHKELRQDMKEGFHEIKELIKNGGR